MLQWDTSGRLRQNLLFCLCLLPLLSKSVLILIKLCTPAGVRKHTHTHILHRVGTCRPLLPSSLCSSCLKTDRLCFQPMFEHGPINAGQREKERGWGAEGAEGGNTIGYWQRFQSLKEWRRQLSEGREERRITRGADCSSRALLSIGLRCVNCPSCLCSIAFTPTV